MRFAYVQKITVMVPEITQVVHEIFMPVPEIGHNDPLPFKKAARINPGQLSIYKRINPITPAIVT
ncbi:hypothetical protein [Jeotgalibacillus haloalkalitolerans]|uniref:hypothetical protein n=1 Tax=Jeotgalibacillus haloalkalitolerans TaxID=3104292 RepID=UPI002ACC1937|nr:hypothetical protein [Jeotgalibacillus sp. HH7-29]